jgi:hypothetical protein
VDFIRDGSKGVWTGVQQFLLRWSSRIGSLLHYPLSHQTSKPPSSDIEKKEVEMTSKPPSFDTGEKEATWKIASIDLSLGFEPIPILLEVDPIYPTRVPASFTYITESRPYQHAHVDRVMSRMGDKWCCQSCSGDYLSIVPMCSCIEATGGAFAYIQDGCLNSYYIERFREVKDGVSTWKMYFCESDLYCHRQQQQVTEEEVWNCLGHTIRDFVKKCSPKCCCSKHCGNCVVQQGITRKLGVRKFIQACERICAIT